jgi:hypothetical protein
LRIKKHEKSHIVELKDGSKWRIWPGDVATTLQWMPTTELSVSPLDDEICSHVLVNREDGSWVRVIDASREWPIGSVQKSLRSG